MTHKSRQTASKLREEKRVDRRSYNTMCFVDEIGQAGALMPSISRGKQPDKIVYPCPGRGPFQNNNRFPWSLS